MAICIDPRTEAFRNLDVWFEKDLSSRGMLKDTCKTCFDQIRDLKHLRFLWYQKRNNFKIVLISKSAML